MIIHSPRPPLPVSDGGQQFPKSVLVDDSDVFLIKAPEGILDYFLRVRPLQSLSEHGEEHGEVDGTRCLVHHVFQVLV